MRWGVLLVVAGCYRPTPPEGAACANTTDCPDPLHCYGGICLAMEPDGRDAQPDADPTCSCNSDTLTCANGSQSCDLGCATTAPGPHCVAVVPSNGVDPNAAMALGPTITITGGDATFDTDTGAISGVFVRSPIEGVDADIAFEKRSFGSAQLGVFSFHRLSISSSGRVLLVGNRAAVFMVDHTVTIDGTIDGSASCPG